MIEQRFLFLAGLAATTLAGCAGTPEGLARHGLAEAPALDIARLPVVGTVSERFLSYNVEMLELTGGRFWKPYGSPAGAKPDLFEDRPPIDLENPRLRLLAKGLAPAYVRYSGTWANATVFSAAETGPEAIPEGYTAVLNGSTWRRAVAFAKASDAGIVLSMPTSPGSRDAEGVWQATDSAKLLDYTHSLGARIAATEFANEPNLIGGTKPPANYTAADYRRDFALFHAWIRKKSPDTLILGPGAFELGRGSVFAPAMKVLPTADLVSTTSRPDAVSFHFYGALSQRCNGAKDIDTHSDAWLSKIDTAISDTRTLRDRINPSAPIWLTETAETACGGNPHAKTFEDTFRFVDQLARAASQGVQVVMHNTLAASDYALLDEKSFAPRPNYWAAYLWKRTMGATVLDGGTLSDRGSLRVYAHCQRGVPGGVTVLAINPDRGQSQVLRIPARAEVFSLTQPDGEPDRAALNGKVLELGPGDAFPRMAGQQRANTVVLPAASVNFIAIPKANNPSCR